MLKNIAAITTLRVKLILILIWAIPPSVSHILRFSTKYLVVIYFLDLNYLDGVFPFNFFNYNYTTPLVRSDGRGVRELMMLMVNKL